MTILFRVLLSFALLTLVSCSGDDDGNKEKVSKKMDKDNVFHDQVQALEKAKGVESTLLNAEKERRNQADSQQ